jgi:hypothetical protein
MSRFNPSVLWVCRDCGRTNKGTCTEGDYFCGCGYSYVHYAGNPDPAPTILGYQQ